MNRRHFIGVGAKAGLALGIYGSCFVAKGYEPRRRIIGWDDSVPVEREVFRVSQVTETNRPKLLDLFAECQGIYLLTSDGAACTRESAAKLKAEAEAVIRQERIDAIVAKARKEQEEGLIRGLVVFQRLSTTEFLAKRWNANVPVFVTTKQELDAFDGDLLPPMYLVRNGTYEYTSVDGAHREVRKFMQTKEYVATDEELKAPATKPPQFVELTRENFVTALRDNGQTFVIRRVESLPCPKCNGTGTVTVQSSGLDLKLVRQECPECRGARRLKAQKEYTIRW